MKRLISYTTLLLTSLITSAQALTVGIAQSIEHPALDQSRQGLVDTLRNADPEIQIRYINAQGDFARNRSIAQYLTQDPEHIVIGIGTQSAQALLAARKNTSNSAPVAFLSLTDPINAGIINDAPPTVFGVSNYIPVADQLEAFLDALPAIQTLGTLYNPSELNSVTLLQELQQTAGLKGITIKAKAISRPSEALTAARSLSKSCDALFINNDNTALSAIPAIVGAATQRNIPVLCSDPDTLPDGVFLAYGPDQYTLGCQAADLVLAFIDENPTISPIVYPKSAQLYVNSSCAQRLGIAIDDINAQPYE